jgi:hypothetical protein
LVNTRNFEYAFFGFISQYLFSTWDISQGFHQ